MHTTRLSENTVALHNGDFSGEIILRQARGAEGVEVTMLVTADELIELVAAMVRQEKIEELERSSAWELVGLKPV